MAKLKLVVEPYREKFVKRINIFIMAPDNKSIWHRRQIVARPGTKFKAAQVDEILEDFIDKEIKWPVTEYKLVPIKGTSQPTFKLVSPASTAFLEAVANHFAKLEQQNTPEAIQNHENLKEASPNGESPVAISESEPVTAVE